jgi:hypothetical protein
VRTQGNENGTVRARREPNGDAGAEESQAERRPQRYLNAEIVTILSQGRKGRGWSYRTAARQMGLSVGMVWMLDHGQRVPSTVVAELLIEGYKLSYAEADLVRSAALPHVGRDWRPPKGYVMKSRDTAALLGERRVRRTPW